MPHRLLLNYRGLKPLEEVNAQILELFSVVSIRELTQLRAPGLLARLTQFWGLPGLFDPWQDGRRPRNLRMIEAARELWLFVSSPVEGLLDRAQFKMYRRAVLTTLAALQMWQVCAVEVRVRKDEVVASLTAAFRVGGNHGLDGFFVPGR